MTGSLARLVKRSRARLWIGDETTKEKQMKPDSEHPAAIPKTLHADNCSDRVVFILPQMPPAHCGLGDYSMILLEHMAMTPPPKILVMHGAAETNAAHPELDVEQLPRRREGLLQRLRELKANRVFVQYVAQGFQSRGCPLWFLGALRQWRMQTTDACLVVMCQELWFEPAVWKPDWMLQRFHRRALRQLAGVVDRLFVSTESFHERMDGAIAPDRLQVLVNPATIPLAGSPSQVQREEGLVVLFGLQGSRIFALQDMAPWLAKLRASGFIKRLLVVGSRETRLMNDREDALVRAMLPVGAAELLGPQSAESLSQVFLRAEMGIFTKTARDFTKSTIFMGYASHGVAILSQKPTGNDAEPLCWVTSAPEILDGTIARADIQNRGRRLAQWYDENASWARVAAAYREALGIT